MKHKINEREENNMGFIKAFTGALSGTFADQWKDFFIWSREKRN